MEHGVTVGVAIASFDYLFSVIIYDNCFFYHFGLVKKATKFKKYVILIKKIIVVMIFLIYSQYTILEKSTNCYC